MNDAPALCPTCGAEIDDSRCVETNYLFGTAGEPGGPVDWYPCGGCLTAFAIEWIPARSIGDDAWRMFPAETPRILIPGSMVALAIERLGAAIAADESKRALADLRAAPESKRLVRIPEVVAAAWPAFGGRAIAAMHLEFHVTLLPETYRSADARRSEWRVTYPVTELHEPTPEVAQHLMQQVDDAGIRKPYRAVGDHATALMTHRTKLLVLGSAGPFVHVKPAKGLLWEDCGELDHFKVTLERLALDPDAP